MYRISLASLRTCGPIGIASLIKLRSQGARKAIQISPKLLLRLGMCFSPLFLPIQTFCLGLKGFKSKFNYVASVILVHWSCNAVKEQGIGNHGKESTELSKQESGKQ